MSAKDLKCCHRTREELDDLLKQSRMNPSISELFTDYFFTNDQAPAPFVALTDIPAKIPRCLKCGHTIDEHLSATANGVHAHIFRAFLDPRNTVRTPTSIAEMVRSQSCCVCGARDSVSCAHILRTVEDACDFGVRFNDASNFLPLCGALGAKLTCHDAFDTRQLCFIAVPQEGGSASSPSVSADAASSTDHGPEAPQKKKPRKWLALFRGEYAKVDPCVVTLLACPSRRVLHAHARLFMSSLSPSDEQRLVSAAQLAMKPSIREWLEQQTPPQVTPNGTLACKGCGRTLGLHLDKNDEPYCAACWVDFGRCDICRSTLLSAGAVESHFEGKKHAKNRSRKE
jgi:hypothetical protein